MPEDPDDHVAMMFHGLVSDLQHNDVAQFDADQKKQAAARAALRKQEPSQGMTAGELLKMLDGDPAEDLKRMERELQRVEAEAKAAVAERDKRAEPLPSGFFPPPPKSG